MHNQKSAGIKLDAIMVTTVEMMQNFIAGSD